jgi:hypothetical protein
LEGRDRAKRRPSFVSSNASRGVALKKAYGYDLDEANGDLRISVYDPNCPDEDDVILSVDVGDPDHPSRITYSADPNGRGFFRTKYNPSDPSAALLTT